MDRQTLKSSSEVWKKFKDFFDSYKAAKGFAAELCNDIQWPQLSEDFEDEIDGYKVQMLHDEIEELYGPCPYKLDDLEEFSRSGQSGPQFGDIIDPNLCLE